MSIFTTLGFLRESNELTNVETYYKLSHIITILQHYLNDSLGVKFPAVFSEKGASCLPEWAEWTESEGDTPQQSTI